MARLRAPVRLLALPAAGLALALAFAVAHGEAAAPLPGAGLAARVEAHLAQPSVRDALRASPGHEGLVFPVAQEDLHAALAPVRVLGRAGRRVVATGQGPEPHGGGVLALLLRHWRPEGRPATLADRYPFGGRAPGVPLADLYASLRHQVFLPVPGRRAAEIAGALPEAAQLARVRFDLRDAGLPWPPSETDAWHALALLAAHEPDPDAAWTNALGQRLTTRLLLDHAGRHYLEADDPAAEPADHGELHLVEVLLGAGEATGVPPAAIQRRFLEGALRRRTFEPADAALVLGHHAESLGALLADPRVRWSPAQARQVAAWLAWLERGPFRRLAETDPRALAHLLRGLRRVERHAGRLGG